MGLTLASDWKITIADDMRLSQKDLGNIIVTPDLVTSFQATEVWRLVGEPVDVGGILSPSGSRITPDNQNSAGE